MPSITRTLSLRGLTCQLHDYSADNTATDAPLMLLLHGLFDTGASFEPLLAALQRHDLTPYRYIAPDWRGHGGSDRAHDGYWFPDYLGDLDALIARLSPQQPVVLVGHSMAGQVASMYAGARPEAVSHLITLDSLNVRDAPVAATAERYRRWLDALRTPLQPKRYASLDAMVERIGRRYPELDAATQIQLARSWTRALPDGELELASDPRHRWPFPYGFRLAEAMALWRAVRAPVLWLEAEHGPTRQWLTGADIAARQACFARCEHRIIAACGHMLHLQAPQAVAAAMADFLTTHAASTAL